MVAQVLRRFPAIFLAIALAVTLAIGGGGGSPALAQDAPQRHALLRSDRQDQAMVMFDGQPLFPLRSSANLSAHERVQLVEQTLEAWLDRVIAEPTLGLQISRQFRNNQPTLTLNGEQLLTLTERDLVSASTPELQAFVWRDRLENAFRQARYERTPAGQRAALLRALAIAAVTLLTQWFLRWTMEASLRRSLGADHSHRFGHWPRPLALLHRIRYPLLAAAVWAWGIPAIAQSFPLGRRLIQTLIVDTLTSPVVQFGEVACSPLDLMALALAIAALWWLAQLLAHWLKVHILGPAEVERSAQEVLSLIVRYGCFGFGMLVLLPAWGLNVSSIAIAASVLGVGLGLGLQNIANNFVSGLIVLLEKPIRVGDFIALGELVGTVERIGARSTEVRTLNGLTIVVPNSRFLENEVINWSHGSPLSRIDVPVGVAYGSAIETVRQALLEAAQDCPMTLETPAPQVWFQAFGASSLDFALLVWIADPRQQFYLRSELNYRIHRALEQYGIEIPFPQQDLHLRSPHLDRLADTLERYLSAPGPRVGSPPAPAHPPNASTTASTNANGNAHGPAHGNTHGAVHGASPQLPPGRRNAKPTDLTGP
jgi:potassium efflux system protein